MTNTARRRGMTWAGREMLVAISMLGALGCGGDSTAAPSSANGGDDDNVKESSPEAGSKPATGSSGTGAKKDSGVGTAKAMDGGVKTPANGNSDPGNTSPGNTGPGDTNSSDGGATNPGSTAKPYVDPGTGAFEVVPKDKVLEVCKLDPDKLAAAEKTATFPWVIIRYGKLCWDHNGSTFTPTEAYSTTKTLGALVTGMVSYQTKDIAKSGKQTGPFSDTDRADYWLTSVPYNKDAQVGHVLGMVARAGASIEEGKRTFQYDVIGADAINSISDMLNVAIAQDTTRLGANLEEFTKKFLYTKLGMTKSSWSGGGKDKTFAYTWSTDLLDMARVGVLINNYGVYNGERLVDKEWIYRMTHPSFEDSNTGFGYLTWLNSKSNWETLSGGKQQKAGTPGPCAPVCIHKSYPHGLSGAKDCGYTAPATCDQQYDVGVWNAEGLGGQLIQGHRGLDMVIVARNAQPGGTGPGTSHDVWEPIRPAVIAGDPMFKGDETKFCDAYGNNKYAPDMHE